MLLKRAGSYQFLNPGGFIQISAKGCTYATVRHSDDVFMGGRECWGFSPSPQRLLNKGLELN